MRAIIYRVSLVALALFLVTARPVIAGPDDDLLRQARERREVEAQRIEKEVREGREYAYRAVRTDLPRALDRVQHLLDVLAKDESLPTERREMLLRTLKRDTGYLRAVAEDRRAAANDAASQAARTEARRTDDPRRTEGPKSAFETARSRVESVGTRVADSRKIRNEVGDRWLATQRSVVESAKLPLDDVEFPADWKEKSKRRAPGPKLTERERAIMDGLKKPVSPDFTSETFSSVMEWVQKVGGFTVVTDKAALDEANVTYETPIALRLNQVTLRTVLKKVLTDLNLTYVIKDENIFITTRARAKEMMVTRAYYIGDLLGISGFAGLGTTALDAQLSVAAIINSIQSQIDPQSWGPEGGGAISFNPATMSLIIRNTAEIHYMLGSR